MKNNKKFTMQIDTGINTSGSIFSRVYNLYILEEKDDYSIINFDCYNLVPSGFVKGSFSLKNILLIFYLINFLLLIQIIKLYH